MAGQLPTRSCGGGYLGEQSWAPRAWHVAVLERKAATRLPGSFSRMFRVRTDKDLLYGHAGGWGGSPQMVYKRETQLTLTSNLRLQSRGIATTPEFLVWGFISF